MADLDLAAIRAELADVVADALPTFTVYDHMAAAPSLPAAHIGAPTAIVYHGTYAGQRSATVPVTLEVPREDPEQAQRLLDVALSWPGLASVIEQHAAVAWTSATVNGAGTSPPRALGSPADGEIASIAVDVPVQIEVA